MNILIVSHYFPPGNSIAALRPYSWAKYWSRMGHQVTVLTSRKLPKSSDLQLDLSGFEIIEHAGRGWFDTKVDGVKAQRDQRNPEAGHYLSRIKRKMVSAMLAKFAQWGVVTTDARMPNLHDIWRREAIDKVKDREWGLVVSTYAPYANHLVVLSLKEVGKKFFWIADYRDLWVKNHLYTGLPVFGWFERRLEDQVNLQADLITTVSEALAEKIQRQWPEAKVAVVENGFDPEDLDQVSVDQKTADRLSIVYTGSIYPGLRDPSPLFEAIKEIKAEQGAGCLQGLEISFAGAGANLNDLIDGYQVSACVKNLGMLPRHVALQMQRDADALLFLESDRGDAAGVLTGKLFEYLASKRPIWAIGITKDSEAGRLIESSGCGVVFHKDVAAIKMALLQLLGPSYVRTPDTPGLPAQYTRKYLAEKMLSLVELR